MTFTMIIQIEFHEKKQTKNLKIWIDLTRNSNMRLHSHEYVYSQWRIHGEVGFKGQNPPPPRGRPYLSVKSKVK